MNPVPYLLRGMIKLAAKPRLVGMGLAQPAAVGGVARQTVFNRRGDGMRHHRALGPMIAAIAILAAGACSSEVAGSGEGQSGGVHTYIDGYCNGEVTTPGPCVTATGSTPAAAPVHAGYSVTAPVGKTILYLPDGSSIVTGSAAGTMKAKLAGPGAVTLYVSVDNGDSAEERVAGFLREALGAGTFTDAGRSAVVLEVTTPAP